MITIIDFGGQTTHLISRRLRELSIDSKIVLPEEVDLNENVDGYILSGGPADTFEKDAPAVDVQLFKRAKPVLGICYGHQLMGELLGGEVKSGEKKEFGPAILTLVQDSPLFADVSTESTAWMNHGNEVSKLPEGFHAVAVTKTIPHAAMANENSRIYGVQFHPEVIHTQFGLQILKNFAQIAGLEPKEKEIDEQFVNDIISDIKDSVKDQRVVGAFSGGIDSSIAGVLIDKAIGKNFTAVYIDSGLMRDGETEELQEIFQKHYSMNIKIVHAKDEFLKNLIGITDPETKRKIIGKTFIDVLNREAEAHGATFLAQGTIYPDVIESMGTKHSKNIKSHHNVGGLPEGMHLTLLEPLRNFYKDEVREIGSLLKLPEEIIHRQPFPGPGLAIRIIGEVTEEKLNILRRSDRIIRDEITKAGLVDKLWQAFAVFTGIKTTGVRGDNRAYGETIAIRAIEAKDAMTANFAHLDFHLLDHMATRIVNEIPEVNRVVYDITNKPPATMEWE